jgi:hypothetical protein
MTMRLDIVTNDAGENVRREHARELGAGVVVALYRLARLAQVHDLTNQAFLRQLEQTHQIISDYCLRAGTNVNILFAQKAVFVAGQLLKGSRGTYESAAELGEIVEWCGGSELAIARDVTQPELLALAEAIGAAMRSERGRGFRSPSNRIRLRAVNDAARLRGLELESLDFEQRIVRNYASAVVIMRRFFEDLAASRYVLPRRIKRVAQNLVDLSAGTTPAFLGVTEVRNANHDDAGRAVNTAILAVAMARELTSDRATLAQIAMAAMMHDVGRPRAAALASAGGPRMSGLTARLSEDAEDRLAAGTAAVLTALGRVNEPSITRTVVAFEALWLRRQEYLGPVYRGVRPPTLHARIVTIARRYNDLLTPAPGLAPPLPEVAIAALADELDEPADRTLLRALAAALGIYPAGTVVELSTGEVAEVVTPSDRAGAAGRLRVRLVMDAHGGVLPSPAEIDLAGGKGNDARQIVRVVSVEGWKNAIDVGRPPPLDTPAPPPPRRPTEPTPSRAGPRQGEGVVSRGATAAPPAATQGAGQPSAPGTPGGGFGTMRAPAPSIPEDSLSAVAGSMGRMIEDALRSGGPVPGAPVPLPHASAVAPGVTSTPATASRTHAPGPFAAAPAAASPAAAPTVAPPAVPRAGKEWTVTDTAPSARAGASEPPPPGAHTVSNMRAAAPATLPPASQPPPSGPTARGTLGATPLAHVLVYMLDHALSGTVTFSETGGPEHFITFHRGAASKVRIGRPTALLGEELVAAGVLQRDALPGALDGARRLGLLIGEYLVGHDLVTREALAAALEAQVGHKVASIVNLPPETAYAFYRDSDLLGTLDMDGTVSGPLNVILATVRTWHDRARIRATLARIAKHTLVFHPDADPLALSLTHAERTVVETIRAQASTVSQLFQRRMADEETLSSLLYVFAVTRQFAFKGQKGPPMGARVVDDTAPPESEDHAPESAVPQTLMPHALAHATVAPPPVPAAAPMFPVSEDARGAKGSVLPPLPMGPALPGAPRLTRRPVTSAPQPAPTAALAAPTERPPPRAVDLPRTVNAPDTGEAERALEAMTSFRLAEAALQRGDVAHAERLAASAVKGDPDEGDYVALYTWIKAMGAHGDSATLDAIQVLTRVVESHPSERALLYRGKLQKRMKRLREALRDFERVLELNPKHREAASEVRLLTQPRAR